MEETTEDRRIMNYTKETAIFCFKEKMNLDMRDGSKKYPTIFTMPIYPSDIKQHHWKDHDRDLVIIGNTTIQRNYYQDAQDLANILNLDLKIFISEIPFYPVCFCFGDNRKFGFVVAPMDSIELRAEIAKITENKPI